MQIVVPRCRVSALCLIVLLAVNTGISSTAYAQKGNKPKAGGKNEQATPLYSVSLFSKPASSVMFASHRPCINEQLQVAGATHMQREDGTYYSGVFFYDPMLHADQAIDLDLAVQGLPDGFTIDRIWGLNDLGVIAVTIQPLDNVHPTSLGASDPNFYEVAGLIDTSNGYQFYSLPDFGSSKVHPRGLNNSNDVVVMDWSYQPDPPMAYVVSFDSSTDDWQISAQLPDFRPQGISERQESGDLFVVGLEYDATGATTATRINVGNPGNGEVRLTPAQVDKDTVYTFGQPSLRGVNSWGAFLGSATSTTERKRRGETTTTSYDLTYLCSESWETITIDHAWSLNDSLDFTAGGLSNAPRSFLYHRDRSERIDLINAVDTTTAPGIGWDNPDLRLRGLDLTNRWVTDDADPSNDLPVVVAFESYVLENPFLANNSYGMLLIPMGQ